MQAIGDYFNILQKGFEHPRILLSIGLLELIPHGKYSLFEQTENMKLRPGVIFFFIILLHIKWPLACDFGSNYGH